MRLKTLLGFMVGLAVLIADVSRAAAPAIPPSAPANVAALVRATGGPVVTVAGDSTTAVGSLLSPAGASPNSTNYVTGYQAYSLLGWIQALAGPGVVIDTAMGNPGDLGGLLREIPITPGACSPNTTLTFTPGAPPGTLTPNVQAGAFTATTNAAGGLAVGSVIVLGAPGAGYTGQPGLAISGGSCSVAPTFAFVLGGQIGWGTPGDTTAGLLGRILYDTGAAASGPSGPSVFCANPADWIGIRIGTNDLAQGVSVATVNANTAAIVGALQACKSHVALYGIAPRNNGTGGWTTTLEKQRLAINRARQNLARGSRLINGIPAVVYIDVDHLSMDATSSTDNPLPTITLDGLHDGPAAAFNAALAFVAAIRPWIPRQMHAPDAQLDAYDAINNPAGNLLGTVGLFLGTSGSTTGCAGTVANNWTAAFTGTGTKTCASSIESTRTDGWSGQRQVLTFSDVSGGTSESIQLQNFTNYASSLTLGTDAIYAEADIDLSNIANVEYVGCRVQESTAGAGQTGYSLYGGNVGGTVLSNSSAQLARIDEAKVLTDFGSTAPGSYKLHCQTPPFKTQAGATGYTFYISMIGTASGVTMSGTLKISNASVRKAF